MAVKQRAFNCSVADGEIPLSGEFFRAIEKQLWIFLVPAAMTLVILVLFLEEMGFFFRNVRSSRRCRLNLWILGIYPVFAVTSLIGLYIPRSASFCSFVASIYHSITLWKFLGLITDFFGGRVKMLERLAGREVSPNPFPCCCCCCFSMISVNRSTLRWMTVGVFQLSVVRTVLFFVLLVLWTDEKYDYGDVDFLNPNSYVNIIIGASTFLSFYGYLLFCKATTSSLQGYGLQGKFVCVAVVLVLFGIQSGILETMGALGVIPCSPPFSIDMRSQVIFNYAVIVEMFFISILARYCFRKVEPDSPPSPGQSKEHKSVQTEETGITSLFKPGLVSLAPRSGNDTELDDALYRIEHAPLDGFTFEAVARSLESSGFNSTRPGNENFSAKPLAAWNGARVRGGASSEMSGVRVEAQINSRDPRRDVTLV